MIRISPEALVLAGRLGQLCRPPTPADGARSWLRSQQFAYDGGHCLTFRASDFQVGVVSRFRVRGEDRPWDRRVTREGYQHFAQIAGGGHYQVTAEPTRCVQIRKEHLEHDGRIFELRFPLFLVESDSPFPGFPDPPTDAAWRTVDVTELQASLGFLTPKGVSADPLSRMTACALLPGGRAVSWAEGVFFVTAGPQLAERIDVYRPVIRRFQRWLEFMAGGGHEQVRVAVAVSPQGRSSFLAATVDGDHLFQALTTPRPLPTDTLDQLDGDGVVLEFVFHREPLAELAGLLRQVRGCKLVIGWHRDEDGAWTMTAQGDETDATARVTLPVSVVRVDPADYVPEGFQVTAESARIALQSFKAERVLIRLRPSTRTLILADADPAGAGMASGPERAYLRTGSLPAVG